MSDQSRPDRDVTEPIPHETDTVSSPHPESPSIDETPTTASAPDHAPTPADPADAAAADEAVLAENTAPPAEEPVDARASDEPADNSVDSAPDAGASETETTVWVPSGSRSAGATAETTRGAEPADHGAAAGRFTWHPEYAGRSVDEVRDELAAEIAADQRQYSIVMEGAEEAEQDALASIVSLERKWGQYDFGWAELDAEDLASRIVAFEQERERRRELIGWSEYRREPGTAGMTDSGELPPAELSTSMKAISLGLVVLLIVVILLAVWAL